MSVDRKLALVKEIQALEAEGCRLASLQVDFVPGIRTTFTDAVARQHVLVTSKRRELAVIIRHEAGRIPRRN